MPYDFTHMWDVINETDEHRDKEKEREINHNTVS